MRFKEVRISFASTTAPSPDFFFNQTTFGSGSDLFLKLFDKFRFC
jgi:hypothetical protein